MHTQYYLVNVRMVLYIWRCMCLLVCACARVHCDAVYICRSAGRLCRPSERSFACDYEFCWSTPGAAEVPGPCRRRRRARCRFGLGCLGRLRWCVVRGPRKLRARACSCLPKRARGRPGGARQTRPRKGVPESPSSESRRPTRRPQSGRQATGARARGTLPPRRSSRAKRRQPAQPPVSSLASCSGARLTRAASDRSSEAETRC